MDRLKDSGRDLGPYFALPATTTVTGLQIRTSTRPGAAPERAPRWLLLICLTSDSLPLTSYGIPN